MDTLPTVADPAVLVGFETSDDGAVYRLTDDLAVVQTLDVLTPVVDDPYDFGRIAAANSISDIYAMGAAPRFALSFIGFPTDKLPMTVLQQISAGGAATAAEAGIPIIGGHTIDDPEPKYGLCVTGTVHPNRVVTNSAGRPGDVLVLTKPLGIGVLTTASKRGKGRPAELAAAVDVMAALNAGASRAAASIGARCATDVTGFGLLGHLHEIAAGSGLQAVVDSAAVPYLDGAQRHAAADVFPGGSRRNLAHIRGRVDAGEADESTLLLLADAQTSGGLLIAAPEERVSELLAALRAEGVGTRAVVGRLESGPAGRIVVR